MTEQTRQHDAVRFEPKDVPPLLPLWLAAGLSGFIIIVLVGITLFYPLANRQADRGPSQQLPPAPRLAVAPQADLDRYQAAKARELRQTAVPIDTAIRATVEQGWGPPK